uniref:DUF106 domain-containing protein n=1 Tax=Archaeoglobus fulgidus TaxID=2234 RepID=A0A7C3ZPT5_ARCFL
MKQVISRFIMILGAIFFIGILFSKEFRIEMGVIVELVMFPFSSYPFHIVILIVSILTGIYSNLIQKYTINYQRFRELQEIIEKLPERILGGQQSKTISSS